MFSVKSQRVDVGSCGPGVPVAFFCLSPVSPATDHTQMSECG